MKLSPRRSVFSFKRDTGHIEDVGDLLAVGRDPRTDDGSQFGDVLGRENLLSGQVGNEKD